MADLPKRRLVELAEEKLASARTLLAASHSGDAYYLAGYPAELMLKAIIVKRFQAETLPDKKLVNDVHTHDFAKLALLAEVQGELNASQKSNPDFHGLWQIVLRWSEQARYDSRTEGDARALIDALSEPNRGVLKWLRQHL